MIPHSRIPTGRGVTAVAVIAAVAAMLMPAGGCGRDARLVGHEIRDPQVGPVNAYGLTLDENTAPREVVFVLLRAIVDDYAAGGDRAKRESALDTQFAVCAPEYIKQKSAGNARSEQTQLERLYRVVHYWAPTLGHYRASFSGAFPDVAQRMHIEYPLQPVAKTEFANVYINLDHPDPATAGPNSGVVALVRLVREKGYWRVFWVGFDNTMRDWRTRFPPEPPQAPVAPTSTPPAAVPPEPGTGQ